MGGGIGVPPILQLAKELDKPIIIHSRDAAADTLSIKIIKNLLVSSSLFLMPKKIATGMMTAR